MSPVPPAPKPAKMGAAVNGSAAANAAVAGQAPGLSTGEPRRGQHLRFLNSADTMAQINGTAAATRENRADPSEHQIETTTRP